MDTHDLKTPLPATGELDLETWLTGDYYSICYHAATRQVQQTGHFHTEEGSFWTCCDTDIPETVKTLDQLLDYMVRETGLERRPILRLYWTAREQELTLSGDSILVGRSHHCDLTFRDGPWQKYLSRQHVRFSLRGGQWHLEDLMATNRTQINDIPVEPGSITPLTPGDRLRFNRLSDEFIFDPPSESRLRR